MLEVPTTGVSMVLSLKNSTRFSFSDRKTVALVYLRLLQGTEQLRKLGNVCHDMITPLAHMHGINSYLEVDQHV